MRLKYIAFVVLLSAGCSKKTASPAVGSGSGSAMAVGSGSNSGSGSGSAVVVASEAPPCPEGDELKKQAAALFAVPADKIDEVSCARGKFPDSGWAIHARHWAASEDDNMLTERTALVDATGKLLGNAEQELPPGASDSSGSSDHQAIDLDGDGVDELVYVFASDKRGIMQEFVMVERLNKHTFEGIFQHQFKFDNEASEPEDGVVSCEATWKIDPPGADKKRTITFEPTAKVKGKGEECIEKTEVWELGAEGKLTMRK